MKSLSLVGEAAAEAALLMLDGIWLRDGVIIRLKQSATPPALSLAVREADNSLYGVEKELREFWGQGFDAKSLQRVLEQNWRGFASLDRHGWRTSKIRSEAVRYSTHYVSTGRGYGLRWYNAATGQYDFAKDAGWTLNRLPPRGKPKTK
jgi:hypothetical protein